MKKIIALTFLTFSTVLSAHTSDCSLFDSLTPETSRDTVSYSDYFNTSKTPEKFQMFANQIVALFDDTIKGLGGNLTKEFLWESSDLNAYADKNKSDWKIVFHGALYRDRRITDDGFVLTVCHELGHLLGGAPFKLGKESSAEGQADFWATAVCAKKYFTAYPSDVVMSYPLVKDQCVAKFEGDIEAQKICYRTAMAGYSLANFLGLQSEGKSPNFHTPDKHVVDLTNQMHPLAQCRLDTYLAGTLCTLEDSSITFQEKLLGDKLTTDFKCNEVVQGQLTTVEERPKCWFNELNNSVFVKEFNPKVKAKKLIGGFQGGKFYLDYDNHLPGKYKIKLVPDIFSEAYVDVTTPAYEVILPAASSLNNLVFEYKFRRDVKNSEVKFTLIVEYEGKVILKRASAAILRPY